jgi:hypothetical protein
LILVDANLLLYAATHDRGFARFEGLRWERSLAG